MITIKQKIKHDKSQNPLQSHLQERTMINTLAPTLRLGFLDPSQHLPVSVSLMFFGKWGHCILFFNSCLPLNTSQLSILAHLIFILLYCFTDILYYKRAVIYPLICWWHFSSFWFFTHFTTMFLWTQCFDYADGTEKFNYHSLDTY